MSNEIFKHTALFVAVLSTLFSYSQERKSDYVHFIPTDYKVLALEEFDLDQDGDLDACLVIAPVDEAEQSDKFHGQNTPKRILKVLRNHNGKIDLWAESDEVVYCVDCGGMMGDPFVGVDLTFRKLIVYHYGGSNWRWTHNITFTLRNDDEWVLYKVENSSYHVFNIDSTRVTEVDSLVGADRVSLKDYRQEE